MFDNENELVTQVNAAARQMQMIGVAVLRDGMVRAPAGRGCPSCYERGHVWIKAGAISERHTCFWCGWSRIYLVR